MKQMVFPAAFRVMCIALLVLGSRMKSSGQTNRVFGVDVSAVQQQGTINWSQVAEASIIDGSQSYPVTFAYIRASKGSSNVDNCEFIDPDFASRASAATSAGLLVGAYHVPLVTNELTGASFSPDDEAVFFVNVASNYIKAGNLRPFLDMETNSCGNPADIGWSSLASWVNEWMIKVHSLTGVWPLLYCSGDFRTELGPYLSGEYDLFVADYLNPANPDGTPAISPWNSFVLYQYSDSGNVSGIGNVDMDVFQGTPQSFQSLVVIPTAATTIPVTIATAPSGLDVVIDNDTPALTAPVMTNWNSGSSHTLSAASPQYSLNSQTQYVFAAWSTGSGNNSISVTPTNATTYTAFFNQLYLLNVNSGAGGTVSSSGGFYAPGTPLTITATPSNGYSFSGWTGTGTGAYTGPSNAANVTMNGAITENATFTANLPPGSGIITLATNSTSPGNIAADGRNVYWTEYDNSGVVKKIARTGGTATILASNYYATFGIALDSSYVYFSAETAGGNSILRVPKGGGAATPVVSVYSSSEMAVDGTNVYWTQYTAGTVLKAPVGGGSVTTLASGYQYATGIALDSGNVYWTDANSPSHVWKISKAGGSITQLAGNANAPGIASDGASIFWAEDVFAGNGKIDRVPIGGGTVASLVTGLNQPWSVAVDANYVYWVEYTTNGAVKQVAKWGGPPITLASGLTNPYAIAIDSNYVYWSDAYAVKAVPKGTIGPLLGGAIVNQGALSFTVSGPAGSNAILQYSSNLTNWNSMSTSTIPASGFFPVTNPIQLSTPRQYFRELLQ